MAQLALLSAVAIWGSTFVVTKVALAEIGPVMLALLRFGLATVVLLPFGLKARKGFPLPLGSLALLGFLGVTVFFSLQNIGLFYTSATNAGLILGSIPVFTLILSAVVLREPITLIKGVGVTLSVMGVFIIVLAGTVTPGGSSPLAGNLLVLASALAWAAYTVKGKSLVATLPQQLVTTATIAFGFIFLVPLALGEARLAGEVTFTVPLVLSIAYLGLAASGAAFFLWNFGLRSVSAAEAGTFTNLSPVVAVLTGYLILGEPVSAAHFVGGAFVMGGVYLTGRPSGRSIAKQRDTR